MPIIYSHEYYMGEALKEARKALDIDEIPVGAVVVANNIIIARTHNLTERLSDVTAHAEMQAITSAANYLGSKYLQGCSIYVTLEPCIMCAGALFWSQVSELIIGARDEKRGYSILKQAVLHPKTNVLTGVMQNESEQLLKQFFASKR